jgi:membrane associated rhomboid family serine protease
MNEPVCISAILVLTGLSSYWGFRNQEWEQRFIFNPEAILAGKEYYRLVTPAFLHAGWSHLLLNLISLYAFGSTLELWLGWANFLLIYFGAVVGGNLLSLYVHRHHDYRAYGASGGVCGVIFAYILLFPGGGISPFFLPVPIPGWLYALGFMLGSFYGMRSNRDNIGHDAHLGGAIVGLLITAGLEPAAVRANWGTFLGILAVAVLLLVSLWTTPLWLPLAPFLARLTSQRSRRVNLPRYKQQALQVDAILEKIASKGIDSLTADERGLLAETSVKYQRREQSDKPQSGLTI